MRAVSFSLHGVLNNLKIIRNQICLPPLIPGSDYMCWTAIICRF